MRYNNEHFVGFSRSIQSTFGDAPDSFADGSIDLLHIDGRRSYEAVKCDFKSWFPKLSGHAAVFFHKTNIGERESGGWKFFLELSQQYSGRSFSFFHSNGLSVLILGGDAPTDIQCLEDGDITFAQPAFSTFGEFVKAQATEMILLSAVKQLKLVLQDVVCAAENAEKARIENAIIHMEQIKVCETKKRKIEVSGYKAELLLSYRLQEALRELEMARKQNEFLMASRSMRLTKLFRDLFDFARSFGR